MFRLDADEFWNKEATDDEEGLAIEEFKEFGGADGKLGGEASKELLKELLELDVLTGGGMNKLLLCSAIGSGFINAGFMGWTGATETMPVS